MSEQLSRYPAVAEIDLQALAHNVQKMREFAPNSRHMGIIKADSYGHGRALFAVQLAKLGYDIVGIAQLAEALEARKELDAAGFQNVAVFSWILPPVGEDTLRDALQTGIELSVSTPAQIEAITSAYASLTQAQQAASSRAAARIHLKVDTGMGRAGATPEEFPALVDAAIQAQKSGIQIVGVWSHLARADEAGEDGNAATMRQLEIFKTAAKLAKDRGLEGFQLHLAASSGQIWHPNTHFDMVRDGIAMYGLSPDPANTATLDLGLQPVMTLKAQLTSVKKVKAGQTVSYGGTWIAQRDTWLALVPLGYGDGIPRHASNAGPVHVQTRQGTVRTHVVGRVCMDQFVIDLGPANKAPANPGDWAILFGNPQRLSTAGCPTADDWAKASGTINYEIVTRLGARVPRIIFEGEPR
ncbi:MAG: alanine racemase [Actinomycetaceae bacterium]|nr:alanine racemase [Actinomycetaceae bacterium]